MNQLEETAFDIYQQGIDNKLKELTAICEKMKKLQNKPSLSEKDLKQLIKLNKEAAYLEEAVADTYKVIDQRLFPEIKH